MNKLSKGERMVLWTGVALFVLSWIPLWAKAEASAFGFSVSESANAFQGFGFFPVELGLILAYVALALVIARVAGAKMSLPGATYAGLCGAATVLLILGILIGPDDGGAGAVGVEVSRGLMLFVGTVVAAAMAWGGYQHMNEGAAAPTTPPVPQAPQAP
jgi:hypothetical protein